MVKTVEDGTRLHQGLSIDSQTFAINAYWDAEAQVWILTSNDVSGLVIGDRTYEGAINEARLAIPDLMELGGTPCGEFSLVVSVRPIEELIADG